jgi:prevent-host-death family protein
MPSAWEGSMAEAKTKTISSTEFQRNIGAVIDQVRNGKSAVIVAAHGRPQVAILPVDEYDALMEARRQLAWTRLARLTTESVAPPTDQVLEASTGDD